MLSSKSNQTYMKAPIWLQTTQGSVGDIF